MIITFLLWICLVLPLLPRFLPTLCTILWLKMKGFAREATDLRLEIADLKKLQSEVSMMDEFAKHAKLQRRINTKSNSLKTLDQKHAWIKWKAGLFSKIAIYVLSAIFVFMYRYEPVVIFDLSGYEDNMLVYIVGKIIAFPTGVVGAVGMPAAMLSSKFVVDSAFDLLAKRNATREPQLISDPVD